MKRLLTPLLLLALLLAAVPAFAGSYSGVSGAFTPPATPTDMATICGSASRTILVDHIYLSSTQTTAGINRFLLVKRSTADTAGTFVTDTAVPHVAGGAAATATIGHYTANPTLGNTIGSVRSVLWLSPAPASVISDIVIDLLAAVNPMSGVEPILLSGTGACLAVNFAGAALPGGLSMAIEWVWREY